MKVYLVGGAVRDALLSRKIVDRDYVVVKSTPDKMIKLGFTAIGKDFPVFLHPKTHEEYALARCEKKTGVGYHGFSCYFAPDVSLEQDLFRRDLTINAMAFDIETKCIIDPYHGQHDLEKGILRAVSDTFIEDPLRTLRVARFAAQLQEVKPFEIAKETLQIMRQMKTELQYLSSERIWQEWFKAFSSLFPDVFIDVLNQANLLPFFFACDAEVLDQWILSFKTLWDKSPYSPKKSEETIVFISEHQQIQRFILQQSNPKSLVLYHLALFFCCLKNLNIKKVDNLKVIQYTHLFCQRFKVPKDLSELLCLYVQDETYLLHTVFSFNADEILRLFNRWDGNRRMQRLEYWTEINTMIHESWLYVFKNLKNQKPQAGLTGLSAKQNKEVKQSEWLSNFLC